MRKRLSTRILALCSLPVAAGIAYFSLAPRMMHARQRAVTQQMLDSNDPADRARAAWRAVENRDIALVPALVQRAMGDETDTHAREACIYALGRFRDPGGLPAALHAIDLDSSGVVRASAWLTFARIDEDRFRTDIAARKLVDPWEQIGVAQALLDFGDTSRIDFLLHWATAGDHEQRQISSAALTKNLRPLLEAAGRWPLDATIAEGEIWPPELVADVTRRAASLDMAAISRDTQFHNERAQNLRSTLRRVTSGRERIARWLFRQ